MRISDWSSDVCSSDLSTVSGNTTTDVYSSGDVTAAVADVASADGKTKGGATFYAEYGNVDATVSGVAGSIVGYSGGASRTVENTFVAVPPAGKTTVTNEFNSAYEAGSVKIATTSTSAEIGRASCRERVCQ